MNKKIKNILFLLIVIGISFSFKINNLKAACSITVSAPKNAVAGSNFKVTANVSSDVGSWYYVLSYDATKVQLVSGSTKVVGVIGDSKTNTYTFKALTSGVASFKAANVSLASNSTNQQCSASLSAASTTIKTQAEIEASYSRNNNLSALSVEGASLSPAFDSNITEYSVNLPVDTTKAKVLATTQDSNAQVNGAGEIDVVDGTNKVEITVTAQHGEKKTYTINITVEELEPINVNVDGKKYTIVRKKGQVENIPATFVEDKITIQNQEVVAYKSKTAKLTLLALKDTDGNIKLFIYNTSSKKFSSFNEVIGSANLLVLDKAEDDIPKDFKLTKFKINDTQIKGYKYKYDDDDNYYLVYAQNLETGIKDFYLYDKKEGTYQRYYTNLIETKDLHTKYMFYVACILILLILLIIIIKLLKKLFTSKERKIRNYQKKIDKIKSKMSDNKSSYSYSVDNLDEKPVIEKVDTSEYTVPKKSKKEKLKELSLAKEKLDESKRKSSFKRVSLDDYDDDDL